jgi:hypothetical protein
MKRDEDIEPKLRRSPVDDGDDSDLLIGSGSGAGRRWVRPGGPATSRGGTFKPQSEPLPPLKVPATALNKRVPSYPAWEKPPSPYNYPRRRGREEHKALPAMWPLLIAAIGVAFVIGFLVVIPALTGHGGHAAIASGSPSPDAGASTQPNGSSLPSESLGPSPVGSGPAASPTAAGPAVSYRQYKVVAGDTLSRVATKFGVKSWEILLVNPQITNPNVLQVGKFINIPPPGVLTPPPAPSAT